MKLHELVSDPMVFEVPYNVVTWNGTDKQFLFSNFVTDTIPEELENRTIKHIAMCDGYLEIEI